MTHTLLSAALSMVDLFFRGSGGLSPSYKNSKHHIVCFSIDWLWFNHPFNSMEHNEYNHSLNTDNTCLLSEGNLLKTVGVWKCVLTRVLSTWTNAPTKWHFRMSTRVNKTWTGLLIEPAVLFCPDLALKLCVVWRRPAHVPTSVQFSSWSEYTPLCLCHDSCKSFP